MKQQAKGSFKVTLAPLAQEDDPGGGAALGRMSLDKIFHGDLVGVGRGEMLSAMTKTSGSAGYVAIERINGSLHGREGSFVFQHSGSMDRGKQSLRISVVPDSGTGALMGIAGDFKLHIADGHHTYEFEYTLPDEPA